MLRSAYVKVYRKPMLKEFLIGKFIIILRVNVAHIIPGTSRTAGHCRGFTLTFYSVFIILFPLCSIFKRSLTILSLVVLKLRKYKRKLTFRKELYFTFFCMYYRNRLSPITLSCKYPLSEMVVDLSSCNSYFN